MLGRQHLIYGVSTATALAFAFLDSDIIYFQNSGFLIAGAAIGSLLPDIDTPKSTIGHICPIISLLFSKIMKHRTYTHDLAIWIPVAFFLTMRYPVLFGLFFGYLSHLFLDGFTTGGIPLFYFFHKNPIHLLPRFMRFHADSLIAKITTVVITIANIAIINNISPIL